MVCLSLPSLSVYRKWILFFNRLFYNNRPVYLVQPLWKVTVTFRLLGCLGRPSSSRLHSICSFPVPPATTMEQSSLWGYYKDLWRYWWVLNRFPFHKLFFVGHSKGWFSITHVCVHSYDPQTFSYHHVPQSNTSRYSIVLVNNQVHLD